MSQFITTAEDAIIAALRAGMPYLAHDGVAGYGMEFDNLSDIVVPRLPLVLVRYDGRRLERDAENDLPQSVWDVTQWRLFVAAKNLRGERAARRDAGAGAYKLLDDVRTSINAVRLGLSGCEALEITEESPLVFSQSAAIAVYTVRCEWRFLQDA